MVFSTMHDPTTDPSEMDRTVLKAAPYPHPALQFAYPLPYGAIIHEGGVQFVVFSRSATAMRLLLYSRADDPEPAEVIPFDRETDRWGDVWSIYVPGISSAANASTDGRGSSILMRGPWRADSCPRPTASSVRRNAS